MAGKDPLCDFDAGLYEVTKDFWLPGKLVHPRRAVDAAVNMELDDCDVIMAAYPKTGRTVFLFGFCYCCLFVFLNVFGGHVYMSYLRPHVPLF